MPAKAVIITGGAKRVGRELALALAARGVDIFLHYNNSHSAALQTQQEIEKMGVRCVLHRADLRDLASCATLIDAAFSALPHCNALINNASTFYRVDYAHTSLSYFEESFKIHCFAPFALIQRFLGHIKSDYSIISIVDVLVQKSTSPFFAYLMSKKALLALTEALAAEGVAIHAICPGKLIPGSSCADPAQYSLSSIVGEVQQRLGL
jgi:pteridine reductase